MRSRRVVAAVACAAALVMAITPGAGAAPGNTTSAVAPAGSDEVYAWPASGELVLAGRGYGHGHGMSQWGAFGAARSGLTSSQILAHYYPGTALTTRPARWLRVWSTGAGSSATTVLAETGMSLSVPGTSEVALPATLDGAGTVDMWRTQRNGATLTVQGHAGGTWRPFPLPPEASPAALLFSAPDGTVAEVRGSASRVHRGKVRSVRDGTSVRTVIVLPIEDYLRSVVPSEMPSSWDPAALQAQAVAARTYATWDAESPAAWYDTCDTTRCQVYSGAADVSSAGVRKSHESVRTDAAIAATAGKVLTYAGEVAFTQFSASNGGWSAAGSRPYLAAFADPYDGVVPSSAHAWTTTIRRSTLQAAYPAIGTPTALRVVARDGRGEWGGRVVTVELLGTKGTTTLSGSAFRSALGLKSTWWRPSISRAPGGSHDYDGDGLPDVLGTRSDGTLWLHPGNGLGGFGSAKQIGHGWRSVHLVPVGDLNGDGEADVVAWTDDGTLWLYPGTGRGWFGSRTQIGHGWRSVRALAGVGDLDRDGKSDLVATFTDGTLWLFPGSGHGWFQPRRPIGHGWAQVDTLLGTGDFDGDARVDVLARDITGRLWLYRGNGRGWFSAIDPVGTGWSGVTHMVSPGDWSGDGWPDVLGVYPGGSMRLFPGNGRGWFGTSVEISKGWADYLDVA